MSKIPSGLKCEITLEQAYQHGVPEVPDGWEFDGFRSAKEGECYLPAAKSASIVHTASGDHAEVYPLIIVRRKPEPHVFEPSDSRLFCAKCTRSVHHPIHIKAKPPACARSIVHGHCPCKDRCCFCHYEAGKPGKNLQWVVEFPYDEPAGPTPDGLLQQATFRVIRQVKPISRAAIRSNRSALMGWSFTVDNIVGLLRELGVAVED